MAFGEAVAKGVLPPDVTSVLYLVVALSMALTPYLAALGGRMGQVRTGPRGRDLPWG